MFFRKKCQHDDVIISEVMISPEHHGGMAQLNGEITLEIEECGSLLYRMADLWGDMTEKERNKADKRAREFNAKRLS